MRSHRKDPKSLDRLVQSVRPEYELPTGLTARVAAAVADAPAARPVTSRRPLVYAGATVLSLAVLALVGLGLAAGRRHVAPPATGRPLFVLITVRGDARDGQGRRLKVGDQLAAGAVLRTGDTGQVVMVTRNGSGFVVGARSEVMAAPDGQTVTLRSGRLYCRNWKHEFAAVNTAPGRIALLGTVIDAAVKDRNQVAVTVVEGKVKLANAHGQAVVPAGHRALLLASAAPDAGAAADVLAETAWVEGTLYFSYAEHWDVNGSSEEQRVALTGTVLTDNGMPSNDADRAPSGNSIVWSQGPDGPHAAKGLFVTRADGSTLNLTKQAGLRGSNCKPKWSPDARMIAFQHCDRLTDLRPCQEGFSSWVMNADGSGAHPLAPAGTPSYFGPTWFPDGTLLLEVEAAEPTQYRISLPADEWVKVPVVMGEPQWSPDRRQLVYTARVPAVQNGKAGVWHQLVLADGLGYHPRVLVQQFLADDEIAQYYPTPEQKKADPKWDWTRDLQYHVGPAEPQWSPSGDQIAFRAALPFDPAGRYYREQVQVWIYDLKTDKLVQVTYSGAHYSLVWSPNKLPANRSRGGAGGGTR